MPDSSEVNAQEVLRRLRESEELYARAFMSNPVPMTITEAATERFTHVNASFCTLIGFPRAEVMGRTSEQLRLWPDRERRKDIGQRIVRDEPMPLVHGTIRTKTGIEVPILASFRLIAVGEAQSVLSVIVPLPG